MAYLYQSLKEPISVFIERSYLTGEASNELELGEILGIFSYKDHVPSFKILLHNGAIWDFCLPSQLSWKKLNDSNRQLGLNHLVYHNSPSCNFALYQELRFLDRPIDVFFKKSETWVYEAQYLLTIDWWTKNESNNLLKLPNGQLAFVPNHKMLVRLNDSLPKELPKYRAMKEEGEI